MIKIQLHLNRIDSQDYLVSLANNLWLFLNQKTAKKKYKKNSLINKLEKLVTESNEEKYLMNIANGNHITLERQRNFFNYLAENSYSKLYELIVSPPDRLAELRREIYDIINENDIYFEYQGKFKQTEFGEILIDRLFTYNNFRKSDYCSNLMGQAGYNNVTCPYCNYNRVNIIDISEEENPETLMRAYLDLDHFYPKSQNPFLALSFFNLIPSCHDCNSREKGDKQFDISTHIHPYLGSFDDIYSFEINPNFFIDRKTDFIKINYVGVNTDYTDRDFKLSQRYQAIYLESINNFLQFYLKYYSYRNSPNFSIDWQDVLLRGIPVVQHEILKYPTGKLFRDVVRQIDIYDLIP